MATDLDGKIVLFNRGAENLLGWRADELIGQTPECIHLAEEVLARSRELTEMEGRPIEGFQVFVHLASKGFSETRQWTYVRKDGHRFPVSLVVTAMRDSSGAIVGFMGVATDISQAIAYQEELRKAMKAAESASRAKSAFLANMSHEIRTPMNGVLGMLGILLDTPLAPDQRQSAQAAYSSAESLLGIINDILDFSKIEAGKLDLEILPFDLVALLDDFSEMFAFRAREKAVSFTCMARPQTPRRLLGDPGRLRQILTNLVGNALKFTSAGEVAVVVESLEVVDGSALLKFSVRDTGIGIPSDRVGGLFASFEQVDASISRRFGGTGLGLAISRQLSEMMGGEIGVESQEGKGSTFWFTAKFRLPEDRQESDAATKSLDGLAALVVDGNSSSRQATVALLRSWGMQVQESASGVEGLENLEAASRRGNPFRLVAVDDRLADLEGVDFGRLARQSDAGKEIVLAVLASTAERGDARKYENAGFSVYLPKPVRSDELLDCLSQALARDPSVLGQPLITRHLVRENTTLPTFHARVLLAEDNLVNQKVAGSMLTKMGIHADMVPDGAAALEALKRTAYDLVLMDMQMPGMDGLEASRRIRAGEAGEEREGVTIIALTANAMTEDQKACREAGMNDHIPKPLSLRTLADTLRKWLEASEGRRDD
ncbi:MAG: response regulator [Fibrobacteria bacterium]|nr:response regulator [Fibrobacteria bacterium]